MPLVDADRIAVWGATEDAVDGLHELVGRLIVASSSTRRRVEGFRTGRGTRMGDYDGFTDVDSGCEYLPAGPAVWEIGSSDPRAKAQDDYEKRTAKPGRVQKRSTTFVTVSPLRWYKDQWESDRNEEREWREVRALDTDSLFRWLLLNPAAHIWLSERLGYSLLHGVVTPEEWWTEYSTLPPLRPETLTNGRHRECRMLVERLESRSPGMVRVHAQEPYEAVAFVIATLMQQDDERREDSLFRMSIVEERDAWRGTFRTATGQMLLVPLFNDRRILPGAVAKGHIVIVPANFAEPPDEHSIILPRPDPRQIRAELQTIAPPGVSELSIAPSAFESVSGLRAALERRQSGESPEWARPTNAREVLSFILAGEWDDAREADRQTIERLAQRSYRELTDILIRWRLTPRPPLQRVGSIWTVVNRADAWRWLHEAVLDNDYARFREAATAVLTEDDPKFELPVGERWMASGMGKTPTHSFRLRHGLADGLALIAATNYEVSGDLSAEDWACLTIREILNPPAGSARWASLAPLLSLLAEACPDEFLHAIERTVADQSELIQELFADQGDSLMSSDSPHVGLLHALEVLARSSDHFSRVAVVLAILASLDPGGRLANRPLNSLSQLFLVGLPQTAASASQRMAALDMLRVRFPNVAWPVMRGALPAAGRIITPAPTPRWRRWPIEGDQ